MLCIWTHDPAPKYIILLIYNYFIGLLFISLCLKKSVLDQPTASPKITQTPVGPIIEGNNVTLTCTIQGGNPIATITWSCEGATQITPKGSPSTEDAISSVELVTSTEKNGQICTCTGRHIFWTNNKTQQHTITVYCKYMYILYYNWVSRLCHDDDVLKLNAQMFAKMNNIYTSTK